MGEIEGAENSVPTHTWEVAAHEQLKWSVDEGMEMTPVQRIHGQTW